MNRILKCIAIDDEPMALLVIEQFCNRKGGIELTTFCEARVGLEEILHTKPDLVFLDIQMDNMSGLEIADVLSNTCCFIFTTAYAEYAIEGFNLDAVDFLYKPFSYERFEIAVEKALRRIDARQSSAAECLIVKQEYCNVSIPFSDILYIKALGNYVKIVRISNTYVLTRVKLKVIMELLPKKLFLRIHRSYIIAISAVSSFTRTRIEIAGLKKGLPVGAQYAEQVMLVLSGKNS